jgi:hypothetical protein
MQELIAADPPIKGPGDDAWWNSIFGDPSDHFFWRSDPSFWFDAKLPKALTPRLLAEAREHDELKDRLQKYLEARHKRP